MLKPFGRLSMVDWHLEADLHKLKHRSQVMHLSNSWFQDLPSILGLNDLWNGKAGLAMEILITQEQIQSRIAELARSIEADYEGRPLSLIGVMTGSLMLLADLARSIQLPSRVGVIQAGSYRGSTTVGGALYINDTFLPDVAGRDVIILDDILDTGHTLSALKDLIAQRGPNSIRTGVLLRKIGRQVVPIEPDYTGFEIPNRFVIGYGLDFNDDYRHLPHIGVLAEDPE